MDCRTCQPTLIDLLHGELATDAADAARAHLRECASCSAAYETLAAGQRFGRTLELADPPLAVSERIMAFAEAHARTAQQQRAAAAVPTAQGMWRSLLDFISRFAMARQVGMVTISLLIVAVGLWSLPQLKGSTSGVPAVAGGTVLNPDAEESAAPSTGVQPAERLGLKMDARAGRILSKDGQALSAPAAAPALSQAPAPEEVVAMAAPAKKGAAASARALDDLDAPFDAEDKRRGSEAERAPSLRSRSEGTAANIGQLASREGASADSAMQSRKSKASGAAAPSAFPKNEYAVGTGTANELRVKQPAPVQAAAPPPQPARASPEGSVVGAESVRRSDEATPSSALEAARQVAVQRGCSAALPRFQQIAATGQSTKEAGEALIEIARCRASLGDRDQARAVLERAVRIAPVAPEARALLRSMEQPLPAAKPASAGPQ